MSVREDQAGVVALVKQLAEDARDLGTAELELVKLRAGAAVTRYKTVAIYFASAGLLALCGFIALQVGLILTLSPLIGAGFATLAVVGGTMVVAAILAYLGRSALVVEPGH